jgi:hypothetical protein
MSTGRPARKSLNLLTRLQNFARFRVFKVAKSAIIQITLAITVTGTTTCLRADAPFVLHFTCRFYGRRISDSRSGSGTHTENS